MIDRYRLILGMVLTFAVIFWITGIYTYYLYYEKGVQMMDAGWLASYVAGNDWRMTNPAAMRNFVPHALYDIHISPFFIPFTYLNRLFPLTPGEQMSVFIGLGFGIYAAAIFVAVAGFLAEKFPAHLNTVAAVAVGAASLLGINGLVFQILIFPHYEAWIPALICVFLLTFLYRRWIAAVIVFVLLLSVREDAGVHLAMILLAVVFFRQMSDGDFRPQALLAKLRSERLPLAIAAAGMLYFFVSSSVGGMEAPRPGGDIIRFLSRIWSVVTRGDWLPLLIALALWAGMTRRPMVLVGFIACLPWVVYNATLNLPFRGFLLGYYGFPLLIVFFFPFVAERFFAASRPAVRKSGKGQKRNVRSQTPPAVTPTAAAVLVVFTVVASLSFRPFDIARNSYEGRPWPSYGFKQILSHGIVPPAAAMRANIGKLRAFYNTHKDEIKIIVDDGFGAPHVHDVPAGGLLMNGADATLLQDDIDILIIHKIWLSRQQSRHAAAARAAFSLRHSYLLRDTKFFIFSKEPLCENGKCIGGLPLVDVQMDSAFAARAAEDFTKNGFYFNPPAIVADGVKVEDGVAVTDAAGIVAEIRNLPLAAGKVALHLEYSHAVADGELPLFQAVWQGGEDTKELPATEGKLSASQIPVTLDEPKYISIRLYHRGGGAFKFHRLTILPIQ